ncbi:hypothetical protein JYU34_021334 [Plutella xylostella]|uniref:Uncharacterized protein n=1 Tax=Plutella xylostella TaxID=51655 RepID=A0ABQ7PUN3_PLUXY|nr:hypothetical protein JYU34_021334 [Plutella xylostella]
MLPRCLPRYLCVSGQKNVIVKKKGTLKGARFCTSAPSCFPVRSKHRADPCPNPQDCHRNCTGKEKEEEEPGCNKNCEGNKPKSKELNCDCIRIQSTHSSKLTSNTQRQSYSSSLSEAYRSKLGACQRRTEEKITCPPPRSVNAIIRRRSVDVVLLLKNNTSSNT